MEPDTIDSNICDGVQKVLDKIFLIDGNKPDEKELEQLELAAVVLSQTDPMMSRLCFEHLLKLDPNNLRCIESLENVNSSLVERWHFRMLNDEHRNKFFESAIDTLHRQKENESAGAGCRLLDIGTGTGLLSLYSHRSGFKSIVACDESKVMCEIAEQTFRLNHCLEQVRLIKRHSTTLSAADISGPVDIIVTETLDCAGFGEGILETLIHAKEHLLKADGKVIPNRIEFVIAGYESKFLSQNQVCLNKDFLKVFNLENYHLCGTWSNFYDTEHCTFIPMNIVTNHARVRGCDFNDIDDMRAVLNGRSNMVVLELCKEKEVLDGFVIWFELCSEGHTLRTQPDPNRCWEQAIFKLNSRLDVSTQTKLTVDVTCREGLLHLRHDYNQEQSQHTMEVGENVISFINDIAYLNELDKQFKSNDPRVYSNAMDFSPFPYIGLKMIKERRANRLFCDKAGKVFITALANINSIPLQSIVFLENITDALDIPDMFDIIIMVPIEKLGSVNSAQVANFYILKTQKLNPGGTMVPHKIEVWCEPVESAWLRRASRVDNKQLDEMGIASQLNQFKTTHQLDMTYYDGKALAEPTFCSELRLNDGFFKRTFSVTIAGPELSTQSTREVPFVIDGIFYFYKIFVGAESDGVSTRSESSHINRACFVMHPTSTKHFIKKPGDSLKMCYVQNRGVLLLTCE